MVCVGVGGMGGCLWEGGRVGERKNNNQYISQFIVNAYMLYCSCNIKNSNSNIFILLSLYIKVHTFQLIYICFRNLMLSYLFSCSCKVSIT